MVERSRKSRDAHGDELGGCHRVCFSGCVFRQYLFFPKLYDSIVFARKVAFGGRLLVREQDELRTAQAADAFVHAAYAAHDASCGLQVVYRMAAVGLRACSGRTGTVERHRGVQLSGGRYGDREPGIPKHGFYAIAYGIGGQQYMQLHGGYPLLDSLTRQQQRDFFAELYAMGRQYIDQNPQVFGGVMSRPVDRRENYVKRCVGLPGQTLQIKDHVVYLDGKPNKEPDNVQYDYFVRLKQAIPDELVRELGISGEDLASLSETGTMPLTQYAYERLKACTDIVDSIAYDNVNSVPDGLYPLNAWTGWTRDNYGPIWIPAKGKSVKLTMDNIAVYERPIRVYEHNDLEVKDGKIFINGKEADSYTFKMDYYWMQGDNRHNSADSRYWGFVPEDHIVGKPILIWLSLDKDRGWFDGHVRWNRLFRLVDHIK